MNAERAQEIAFSKSMSNVTFNGERVYIEHVDRDKDLATIHFINDPNNKESVSVTSLVEQ
ncbi:H-type small acid-soluble spore protein [Psychrobacillus sp. FJAT-51614]|uniref:Small, acid-soluble spore protein H n=1 Tax=Psychrobacillus mangrovi TaxID=3117745 RepID=A0ABU8F4P2_9BACI